MGTWAKQSSQPFMKPPRHLKYHNGVKLAGLGNCEMILIFHSPEVSILTD